MYIYTYMCIHIYTYLIMFLHHSAPYTPLSTSFLTKQVTNSLETCFHTFAFSPQWYMVLRLGTHTNVCYGVLQRVAIGCSVLERVAVCCSVLQRVAVCCSVLQCVPVCCSVLQCAAVCWSVLQFIGACCSVRAYARVMS